jgi:Domain of unknown function (DUF1906)
MAAAALLLAALTVVTVEFAAVPEPARANFGISQNKGIDACDLQNSISNAQAFWTNTPYYNIGLYLGGSSAGCPVQSASYANQLVSMGWDLLLIWVGPQAPCRPAARTHFSTDPSTAYNQGRNEATAAYTKLLNFNLSIVDTPITYDLESLTNYNSQCLAAAKSFIQGWVDQLHVQTAQKAGLYGSVCGSALSSFATLSPPPDYITGADWGTTPHTSTMNCVPSSYWTNFQRHKQYQGDHNERWNGVSISVDSDCSNAPVYPDGNALGSNHDCL